MLHQFLLLHRRELVRICTEKVAARFAPDDPSDAMDNGVPVFIDQLIDALERKPSESPGNKEPGGANVYPKEIGRSAALHGAELLRRGFTVDQVVHDYGDVCQAITEMAIELDSAIDPDDFRILNGCLDNAIAGAVTAHAEGHQAAVDDREDERHQRLSVLREEHRRLVEIAIQAFRAIKIGSLGMGGATGALLMHALTELQALSERALIDGDNAVEAASTRRSSKRNKAP
jgi:hypothetical protein